MRRTFVLAAAATLIGFSAPAFAEVSRSVTVDGPYGGGASASRSCDLGHGCEAEASRTYHGGGEVGVSRNCALGHGCEAEASRTYPGGGSVSVSREGYPAVRAAPRHGVNLGGPVNRRGLR